jgi:hypothetical protein
MNPRAPVITMLPTVASRPGRGNDEQQPPRSIRSRVSNSKLGRVAKARWVHPLTQHYLHAFGDGCAVWLLGLSLLYYGIWAHYREEELQIFVPHAAQVYLKLSDLVRTGHGMNAVFSGVWGLTSNSCLGSCPWSRASTSAAS